MFSTLTANGLKDPSESLFKELATLSGGGVSVPFKMELAKLA